MNKTVSHILSILEKENISAKSFAEVEEIVEYAKKKKQTYEFLIQRLEKNEQITKRFLNVTIKELEDKNKELSKYIESNLQLENFAHIASHDLKAPLINIVSFSQLLTSKLSHLDGTPEYEFVKNIESSALHMQETIKGLFQFSRATNARINVKKFNIRELVDQLLVDIAEKIKKKEVVINVGELPKTVYADPVLIREVLMNLITNAMRYSSNERNPELEINGSENKHEWEIVVSDNGIGIEEEFHESIFVIFNRLHTNKEYAGTGIGLALCKSIIESHGGKIWVESELDKGSSFHFTIRK